MDIQGNQIRIGIDVPKEVKVYREEIIERMKAEDKTPPKFLFNLNGMTAYPHPADGFSRKDSPAGCFLCLLSTRNGRSIKRYIEKEFITA